MNTERDKFLTVAMGEAYYEFECDEPGCSCSEQVNLSMWDGLGKLWEWAQEQDWWEDFACQNHCTNPAHTGEYLVDFIHPDRFATALYEYLKERK